MLDSLRSGLQSAVKKLLGTDIVDEAAIKDFVRDLQRALIQADVNVKLVLSVTESVQRRALEEKPPAGLDRKNQIVKILYEELDKLLGGDQELKLDRAKLQRHRDARHPRLRQDDHRGEAGEVLC